MSKIHPASIIKAGAKIGNNVTIKEFVSISSEVSIGDNTIIESYTLIKGKTKIGRGNHIFSHSIIGSIPQDLKYNGEDVELIIGDNNKIREFVLINPGTEAGGKITKIGDNNLLMAYVHIGHDVKVGNNCVLSHNVALGGHVVCGNGVVIGGNSPVHQFVNIGDFSMVGGGSVVIQDIPPYCLAMGNRAIIKSLNLVGLRRNFSNKDIDTLKIVFKKLFRSNNLLKENSRKLLSKNKSEYVKNLLQFIINSKRGIPLERKE